MKTSSGQSYGHRRTRVKARRGRARGRIGSWLAGFVLAALVATGGAQTYTWTDEAGRERTTEDFDAIPRDRLSDARCVVDVVEVLCGDRFRVTGGHVMRLIGVDAPSPGGAADPVEVERSRQALAALVADRTVTVRFDRRLKNELWDTLVYAETADGTSVNERLLATGLARAAITLPNFRQAPRLRSAQVRARAGRLGLWSREVPATRSETAAFRRGFSLGLFARQTDFDYRPFLREIRDIGASHVMLITPWFLEGPAATTIVPRRHRSSPMAVVETVTREARALGLAVAIMPIVLLHEAPSDQWRGNLEPTDVDAWFSGYTEFILPFADVARNAGAELFVVGSEFSSLERHARHWRQVIANVRGRYDGLLTYSANWDHLDVISWWTDLDLIGMTGYHSLTQGNAPTVAELEAAWCRVRDDVVPRLELKQKPYLFTEIGYASLDGINRDPWDYVTPQVVDAGEQADCYEAWFRTWNPVRGGFRGAYFYTWWRNDDDEDVRQYTVHGKPAEATIRAGFAHERR